MKEALLVLINKERGFTLVETTIAIFVLTIGVGGIFAFLQGTVLLSPGPDNQLVASYLAQEGVEIVRNIRDSNYIDIAEGGSASWDDNLTGCALGCEADYDDLLLVGAASPLQFLEIVSDVNGTRYEYGGGTPTIFQRKIIIVPVPPDQLDMTVEVTWQERGNAQTSTVETQLFNWAF